MRTQHTDRLLILDFGSQYTQLIARRIREIGVYCEVHACTLSEEAIRTFNPRGIILSGGPESVTEHSTPRAPACVFEMNRPVLGICYGMQTMATQLGGHVSKGKEREFGYASVVVDQPSLLLEGLADQRDNQFILDVWMSHGDHVDAIPPGFSITARSEHAIAAIADEKRHFYGVQFHPEVVHTPKGLEIFKNFVLNICACQPTWTTQHILRELIDHTRARVNNEHVILGLSGGVDSSVVAALLQKAIGNQLTCVFVDTGFLRFNESLFIQKWCQDHQIRLIIAHAEDRFYAALKRISDPEQKRKIIGKLFVEVFEEEASQIKNAKWLAQGTIYSDVIESAATEQGTHTHVIKSHHNVGGLPQEITLKLLEPVRFLFKDEVRKLGLELGLPHELVHRHPFPGPGLAIRILGEIKKEWVDLLRRADAILIDELLKNNWYHKVSQAFVVFLPVKSVGVLGDARHYDYVVSIRIVETTDFMTAHIARIPYQLLETISGRIINEVRGISRVVYDISSKPPATIEWE